MKVKIQNLVVRAAVLLALSTLNPQLSTAFAQGSLTPPGPPGPNMKTLDQIEPRTPISSLPYTIANAGSYYLTTNLTGVAGTNGISIIADGVTLDLNGFSLVGVAGSSNGVYAGAGLTSLAVRNGAARNWGRFGVDLGNAVTSQLLDLRVSNNGGGGARAGNYAVLTRCSATVNTTYGLYGGNGSVVEDCTAGFNSGDGLTVGVGGTIAECAAYDNTGSGMVAASTSHLRGCTANHNNIGISTAGYCYIENCSASLNTLQGIYPNSQTTVLNCAAIENSGDGIVINAFSSVTGCTANNNFGNGIYASGDDNRIENNCASYNAGQGIKLHAVNTSVVIRNTAAANTGGNLPAAGSNIGPIQSPASATSPTANFSL